MQYCLRTLLPLAAPLVCAVAVMATLAEYSDYPDAYVWIAAPLALVGIVSYLSGRSGWASAFWIAVSIGMASFAAAILVGEGAALLGQHSGPREEPGTSMGIGIVGLLLWATTVVATPIGAILWWLTKARRPIAPSTTA